MFMCFLSVVRLRVMSMGCIVSDKFDKIKLVIAAACVIGLPKLAISAELLDASSNVAELLSVDDIDSIDSGYAEIDASLTKPDVTTALDMDISKSAPTSVKIIAAEMRISKLQILLDRSGVSPGVINGQKSDYLVHALNVFSEMKDLQIKLDDDDAIDQLIGNAKKELYSYYEITKKDISGPFIEYIPERIQDQGALKALTFGSVEEKLAEHFHMDESFLLRLNPKADFRKVGTRLFVANIGRNLSTKVVSIRANMNSRLVSAYDAKGKIVAIYPASIGSPQNPSPRGTFKVRNKAGFPKYTLSPSNTFELIDDGLPVIVASGPNNPVGIAWIGLSKKSYGIHGTPWPSRVGEAGSHGCIRLTNWDAMELATLVRTGIEVVIE